MHELSTNTKQTMTSLEIAELTGKEHKNVKADIENILNQAGIDMLGFQHVSKNKQNQTIKIYHLPKFECDLVVSGYSVKYRAAIIKRWHELEDQRQKSLTPAEKIIAIGQAMLDQERRIAAVEVEQFETKAQLNALVEGEEYYTVVGYANIVGLKMDAPTASRIGKAATSLCHQREWTTGTAPHPVYGRINTYPREALELVINGEDE